MSTPNREQAVIAGVDGSETALGGVRWAAEFASGQGLPLRLVHAVPRLEWHFAGVELPDGPDRGSAGADAALAAAHDAVRSAHPELAVSAEAVRGSVAETLVAAAESARLLVIGSGATDHRTLGGHVIRITHRVQCPVTVWRNPVARRTGKPLPVVVGVDDSDESARALAEAFEIARGLRAPLTVVHMWEITAAVGMGDLGGQSDMDWQLLDLLQSRQRQRMDELVEPLAAKYPNAHVTKVFQDIGPAKGLAALSREAQLVVVGSHGRGRVATAVLGSVSQNLIHHAECPVLLVR